MWILVRRKFLYAMPGEERIESFFLPESLRGALEKQIDYVIALHNECLQKGFGEVYIPDTLTGKYTNASRENNLIIKEHRLHAKT